MRLFTGLYERVIAWSAHRHAPRYLAALSFAESSFFPVPPDVMLAPMVMARPRRWVVYALVATVASVVGGVAGYAIGALALDLVQPWLAQHAEQYATVRDWFARYGVWVVFAAGFSPIPYKLFTITSGALAMPLLPFVLASFVGRGGRFFLVAALVAWAGPKVEPQLRRYMEWIGWGVVALIAVGLAWYQLR